METKIGWLEHSDVLKKDNKKQLFEYLKVEKLISEEELATCCMNALDREANPCGQGGKTLLSDEKTRLSLSLKEE